MKGLKHILLLTALSFVAACSEKPESNITSPGNGTTVEVSMPSEGSLVWSSGDRIAVVENPGSPAQKSSIYELSEGAGSKHGLFRYVSGEASSETFSEVLFPVSGLESPEVPTVQQHVSGSFDPEAVRMSWHRGSVHAVESIVLENQTALLTFRLTGNGEKMTEVVVRTSRESYSLKVSGVKLENGVKDFQLVIPAMKPVQADITYKAMSGKNEVEMCRQMEAAALKAGTVYRFPLTGFQASGEFRELNLAFYNVAVFSKNLQPDPDSEGHIPAIAAMMKEKRVDALLLAELDKDNKRHNYDQLEVFAGRMGWNWTFAKAFDYGKDLFHLNAAYGNGAAYDKKYKVLDTFTVRFPKYGQEKEDRVCLVTEFEHFVLAGVHMPLYAENSLAAAKKLTEELKARYAGKDKPVFLCGDMNAKPGDPTILELKKYWTGISPEEFTCPADGPTKCLDYMFALKGTGSYEVVFSEVCKGFRSGDVRKTSDHLPLFATLRYPVTTAGTEIPVEHPVEDIW